VSELINKELALAGTTFSPLHRPWEQQCTAYVTDRRTDRQTTWWCQ